MKQCESEANALFRHDHGHTTIATIHHKQVVIKEVSTSCASQECLRLRREAEVLNRVQVDCFPKVITQFENTERFGIVEEFLPGQNLADWMKSTHPAKKARIQVFMQILDIVEILHQNGFLQMSLHLEDLLMYQGKVYLTSFKDCLPIGSLRPLLNDDMTLPPEADQPEPLGIRADQIVLAQVYQQLVGKSVWLKMARAKRPAHRFSSLMDWKCILRITCYQKTIVASLLGAVLLVLFGWCFLTYEDMAFLSQSNLDESKQELGKTTTSYSKTEQTLSNDRSESQREIPKENGASLQTSILANDDGKENLCLKIYQELARNPDQILDVKTWTAYAKQALEQGYLPLVGYLLEHMPANSSGMPLEVQVYEFELGVFCSKTDQTLLEGILRKLPSEPDNQELLSLLMECLMVNQIQADPVKLEHVIESLADQVPLSHDLCTILLNYLLWSQTQQPKIWNIPDVVASELQVHAPDLYGIWIKTQIP